MDEKIPLLKATKNVWSEMKCSIASWPNE